MRLRPTTEVDKKIVGVYGSLLTGAIEYAKASERGVGQFGRMLDGMAGIAVETYQKSASVIAGRTAKVALPLENALELIHGVVSMISPEAGKVTGAFAKAMPGDTAKGLLTGSIDAGEALVKRDWDRLARQHERTLAGEYNVAMQGYAVLFEGVTAALLAAERKNLAPDVVAQISQGDLFAAATAVTDAPELYQFDDAAASGRWGWWAKVGTWLGDRLANMTVTRGR